MTGTDVDVAIIGAGLAGCATAARLKQAGLRFCVIDRPGPVPNEFRAEQIVGPQIGRLDELGLLDNLTRDRRLARSTLNARNGVVLDRTNVEQYGMSYRSMVTAVRAALPETAFVLGRVSDLQTGPDLQQVVMSDGRRITARLIVLATGLLAPLPKQLGIEWQTVSKAHSLCLGFDLAFEEPRGSACLPLVYYGDRVGSQVDYITLFHIDATIRANLFCYRGRNDDWVRIFCNRPDEGLRQVAPSLDRIIGSWRVSKPVECRSNDIKVAVNPVRDGAILIGDAFQTPCPAAGTGIDRILSDVDVLGRLLPGWLASPGMRSHKTAGFYADPAKRAFDAECIRIAMYRRDFVTRNEINWRFHRLRVHLQRRVIQTVKDSLGALNGQKSVRAHAATNWR